MSLRIIWYGIFLYKVRVLVGGSSNSRELSKYDGDKRDQKKTMCLYRVYQSREYSAKEQNMRILHRNGIPFFQHLTVLLFFPVARIIFLKRCYACIKVPEKSQFLDPRHGLYEPAI